MFLSPPLLSKCPCVFPPCFPFTCRTDPFILHPENNPITYINYPKPPLSSRVLILIPSVLFLCPSSSLILFTSFHLQKYGQSFLFLKKKKSKRIEPSPCSHSYWSFIPLSDILGDQSIYLHLTLAPWFSLETQHCFEYLDSPAIQPNGFVLIRILSIWHKLQSHRKRDINWKNASISLPGGKFQGLFLTDNS